MRDLTVAILAGGKSVRMGSDKALLPGPDNLPWLSRIAFLSAQNASRVLIVTGETRRYGEISLPKSAKLICDSVTPCGPLGGILTALEQCETNHLVCVPCDMPGLTQKHFDQVALPLNGTLATYVAGSIYPVALSTSTEVEARLRKAIADQRLSLQQFLKGLAAKEMKGVEMALNLNTPDDATAWAEAHS